MPARSGTPPSAALGRRRRRGLNGGGAGPLYALQANGNLLAIWPRTYATIQGSARSIGDGASEVLRERTESRVF
ncbi:MAG: hypothetical protein AAF726_09595 [Planctomycetota bacterium]